jgi:hypothetical protein
MGVTSDPSVGCIEHTVYTKDRVPVRAAGHHRQSPTVSEKLDVRTAVHALERAVARRRRAGRRYGGDQLIKRGGRRRRLSPLHARATGALSRQNY